MATTPAEQVLTPEQAFTLLQNLDKDEAATPAKHVQACNMIARAAVTWALQAKSRDKKIWEEMIKRTGGRPKTNGAKPANGAAEAHVEEAAPPAQSADGTRMGAGGEPLSQEEEELERQMDAAAEGMPVAGGPPEAEAAP